MKKEITKKLKWEFIPLAGNSIYREKGKKVYLSFQPNKTAVEMGFKDLDGAKPETAIVLQGDKKDGNNRYLIFRGDKRKELQKLYPDVKKLKAYWKKHGGHFWSDNLDN